jgi:hypothetical protein
MVVAVVAAQGLMVRQEVLEEAVEIMEPLLAVQEILHQHHQVKEVVEALELDCLLNHVAVVVAQVQ